MNAILSAEPFEPHTLEHLTQVRAFPSPLPAAFYNGLVEEYRAVKDVSVSRITYESDGLKVTGLRALPSTMGKQSHPLLIYNRGGSREYGKLTVLSAMRSMVPFARKGYLVYASNYRGNDGGEGQEEFGGADLDDVTNLLAIAQEHPSWDGRNAFMIGHSRGGMMTCMAIRRGVKLNAAISIAGVLDAHVLAREPGMVERILTPLVPGYDNDPQKALTARSALDWPADITAPLLLLHGDADKDVDVSGSIRMHEALQKLGKTSELHVYEGGNHALVRHWDEVLKACFAWLKKFTLPV